MVLSEQRFHRIHGGSFRIALSLIRVDFRFIPREMVPHHAKQKDEPNDSEESNREH